MSKILEKLDALRTGALNIEKVQIPKGAIPERRSSAKRAAVMSVFLVFLGGYGGYALYKKMKRQTTVIEKGDTNRTVELTRTYQEALGALEKGNFEVAISGFNKISTEEKDAAEPQINLAFAHKKKGDLETAESVLLKVIDQHPNNATAYNNLGLVYLEMKNDEKAASYLKEALKHGPTYTDPVLNLAYLYELKKDWKEAIKFYTLYMTSPDDKKGYRSLISERVRRLHSFSITTEGKT